MFDLTITNITDAAKAGANEGSTALSNASPTARHLLSTNITVANPVPDLQWEASIEDSYFLNGDDIFSADIVGLKVQSANNQPLPSWLKLGFNVVDTFKINFKGMVVRDELIFVVSSSVFRTYTLGSPVAFNVLGEVELLGSNFNSLAVDSDLAFVANSFINASLLVLDVSDPINPVVIGNMNTTNRIYDIKVNNNFLFLAVDEAGLQVVDISIPSAPIVLATVDTPNLAYNIALQGDVAFVADFSSGLQVVDISNPSNPTIIGNVDTPGFAMKLVWQNELLYIGDTRSLQIVNVSIPTNPVIIGSVDVLSPGSTNDLTLQGGLAFLASAYAGLQVIDVSNPTTPLIVGNMDIPRKIYGGVAAAENIFIANGTAFLGDDAGRIHTVEIDRFFLTGIATKTLVGQHFDLEVVGYQSSGAYLADNFRVTVNQLPKRKDSNFFDQSIFPGDSFSQLIKSDSVFNDPDNHFLTLSASLNNNDELPAWFSLSITPTFLGDVDVDIPDFPLDIALQGDLLFVLLDHLGLEVVDVSDPSNPTSIGQLYRQQYKLVSQNNLVYTVDGSSDLEIVNVSIPSNPVIIGSVDIPSSGYVEDIVLQGGLAFVASGSVGLQVIDISNPTAPTIIGSVDTNIPLYSNARAKSVFLGKSNLLYLHTEPVGFIFMIDIATPSSPSIIGCVDALLHSQAMVLKDEIGIVASLGLQLFDFSNASNPIIIGEVVMPTLCTDLAVVNSLALVTCAPAGLSVVDFSDVAHPAIIGTFGGFETSGNSFGVVTGGKKAYVIDYEDNIKILDLTTWEFTANPTTADVGNYNVEITATDTLGGTTSDSFTLRVEGPPTFNGTLANQSVAVGDAFNYFIPQGLVSDPNFDLIEFDAKLMDGNALPPWLSFNAFSATFSGTPDIDGVHMIRVSATDNIAGSNHALFQLTVGYKPEINTPISDPSPWREGKVSQFMIPDNAFVNLNGNPLVYSAALENNLAFPSWLSFDVDTRTFRGDPPADSAASFILVVTASDAITSLSLDQTFVLTVTPNFAPELANSISRQTAQVSEPFRFTFTDNTFIDRNLDVLNFTATGMPSWLEFDGANRTFSGEAGHGDTNSYANRDHSITVIASDGDLNATTSFILSVEGTSRLELAIRIGSPLLTVLGLAVTAAGLRYCCYNRFCKSKYEALDERHTFDQTGDAVTLDCVGSDVNSFVVKVPRRTPASSCKLFSSNERTLPNGLPDGLVFYAKTSRLLVTDIDAINGYGEMTIQARDGANQILSEIKVDLNTVLDAGQYASETDNPLFGTVDEEAEGVPMEFIEPIKSMPGAGV